ncbi:hypothetical protein A1O3_04771 [Capronia epimyces CBS 606.96]|uniref:F-box domain-containing protein n=1 Tax=Capronia epimyces CBS 606.96 TaxID=1182542 RepID=W9YPB0_9EURO|nr:uncharacterized protein A1O3_04771 [Capronia epimyces CBS 606.96]EXJ84104.1 hypothetical protein A1O3_04771 [Capronia epimyces CBS 606.96]
MPLQSREVVTLSLVFDCWEEDEEDAPVVVEEPEVATHILLLPAEVRLKILRYLLRIDGNRQAHTRRPPTSSVSELLYLNARRILEAAVFKHKGGQEINGSLPIINTCTLQTTVLKTCKQLYREGTSILYNENKVVGLQSGIKGLGAKFRNYGIPVWGPLPASRLISHFSGEAEIKQAKLDPVMLFSSQNTKSDTPFYICSYKDAADFVHALWIMIECPFSKGMRYNLTLSSEPGYRLVNRTDGFVKYAVMPWLHNHITSIDLHRPASSSAPEHEKATKSEEAEKRLQSIRHEHTRHKTASTAEPNVHTYNAICTYLEQVMQQADLCVDQASFMSAELLYERVCYEASGIVRTRTSRLVDVSSKSREGINRVCKLIAVSAYRLCELRSGSLTHSMARRLRDLIAHLSGSVPGVGEGEPQPNSASEHSEKNEATDTSRAKQTSNLTTSSPEDWRTPPSPWRDERMKHTVAAYGQFSEGHEPRLEIPESPYSRYTTTRLDPHLARDLALTNGLLALRLPCASPVPEWNIRLEIMLLRLFAERNDVPNALLSIRRMQTNVDLVWNEAKLKNRAGSRWEALRSLATDLAEQTAPGAKTKCFFETAEQAQDVVAALWGERLRPRKGYNGLIWTFRWAG